MDGVTYRHFTPIVNGRRETSHRPKLVVLHTQHNTQQGSPFKGLHYLSCFPSRKMYLSQFYNYNINADDLSLKFKMKLIKKSQS